MTGLILIGLSVLVLAYGALMFIAYRGRLAEGHGGVWRMGHHEPKQSVVRDTEGHLVNPDGSVREPDEPEQLELEPEDRRQRYDLPGGPTASHPS